jgi:hypothetical protein
MERRWIEWLFSAQLRKRKRERGAQNIRPKNIARRKSELILLEDE